ncbi:penicillin-binding protein 2 [Virgibacillus sp. C22-A2]|uniref:serine-type D-Ala-D-Ala carboxypeptidase n=1 Tax=Virgibacillus tibetensis TaxID=3042313 RepID=A0ABU6KK39_9BACI|nr:penicillin-binding protein 2 [Virgibacillus sp. C22-A2]
MRKNTKNKVVQIPLRLNILFFVVFLLFAALILQLGVVQILNGDSFQEEIDRTIQDTTKIPVPRGKIYDKNYNVVVDNKALYSITYTPAKGIQAKDRLDVAKKLAEFLSMDTDGITERNKKEYWYLLNTEEADSRLSETEADEMTPAEQYSAILETITEEEISNFSDEEKEVIAIKAELDKAYSLTPQVVKNRDVTSTEYAEVAENLGDLPGINATTDWVREYPYENTFRSLAGSITTQEQGIPEDREQYYLTRGYSRNDRVGKSGLEEYYEDILRGRKEEIQYTTEKDGTVIDSTTIVEGNPGKDLILTIDMQFQQEVDKIVQEELEKTIKKHPNQHRYLEDALAVVMNPQTGELLAVSGQTHDKEENEYINTSFKTMHDSHLPGSTIKGATVLAGYESGVTTPGQVFNDRRLKIADDTRGKGSYRDLGPVNDYSALKLSSNVYMFYIALKMGGEHRYPFPDGSNASFNTSAWQEMRNYFRQFGLGAPTGIDYPYESTGLEGNSYQQPGLLMDYAIGQYDTFTTMQLAQYVSTIANDGYRVRPHFLKEIRNPALSTDEQGSVYRSTTTDVLNRIQMDSSEISRVQEGFRQVFQESGGTGYNYFGTPEYRDYKAAGKTGTAENSIDGVNTENLSLVGYAPYDEPEIAFAITIPHLGIVNDRHPINHRIGQRILEAYFEVKKEQDEENESE